MLIDNTTSEDDLIELTLNFDILNIIKVDNNNLELTCKPDTSFYDIKKSLKDASVEILFSDIFTDLYLQLTKKRFRRKTNCNVRRL